MCGDPANRPSWHDPVRDWLDAAAPTDRRRLLNAVDAATGSAGFDAAMAAADTLIRRGDTPDTAALGMLARRLAHGTEPAGRKRRSERL